MKNLSTCLIASAFAVFADAASALPGTFRGTLTFTFTDCNTGRVDFVSTYPGYGSTHMNLTRLTAPAGLTCP